MLRSRTPSLRGPRLLRSRSAYTLVELIAVLTILGVLAAVATPASTGAQTSRRLAARGELARRVELARTFAMATNQQGGITILPGTGEISLVRIIGAGAPEAMPGMTGHTHPALVIHRAFPGIDVTSFVNGDGLQTNRTIWFDPAGTPHLRDGAGAYLGPFTEDALVTLTGGSTVRVRVSTGAVE